MLLPSFALSAGQAKLGIAKKLRKESELRERLGSPQLTCSFASATSRRCATYVASPAL